jgi:hypothetical protein
MMRLFKSAALACVLVFTMVFGASEARAAVYDLMENTTVAIPTAYGTAIFTTEFPQPAGTGRFDPFLTIQGSGVEKGYNTSESVFDTKREPHWNHELKVSDLEQSRTTMNGADYFSFTIDINEPNGGDKSLISLDALKIFVSNKSGKTTTNVEALGKTVFDLDLPRDNYILYNDKNSGSGEADIAFFVPVSAFAGVSSGSYVYMFQQFGGYCAADGDYSSNSGYEETRLGGGGGPQAMMMPPVPEPSAVLPLAGVLGLVLTSRRLGRMVG